MNHKAKWRNFSEDYIKKIVKESTSDRQVAIKLGYRSNSGGASYSLHRMYDELNIDTSHFKGQEWKKDLIDLKTFNLNTYKKIRSALK